MTLNNNVVNGGFETGSLVPWLSLNASINSANSHSGFFRAQLNGGGLNSFIVQLVPITAGDNLELLFSLAKLGALPNPIVSTSVSYYDALFNFLGTGLIVNNISSRLPDAATDDTWLEVYNVTTPAPAGTTQALIAINALPQAGTADVLVDDVEALVVTGAGGATGATGATGAIGATGATGPTGVVTQILNQQFTDIVPFDVQNNVTLTLIATLGPGQKK